MRLISSGFADGGEGRACADLRNRTRPRRRPRPRDFLAALSTVLELNVSQNRGRPATSCEPIEDEDDDDYEDD